MAQGDKQIGATLVSGGFNEKGEPFGGTLEIPTYVCGHCSATVALNPLRMRERKMCRKCESLICLQTPICSTECIPIHSLARDHFEGPLGARAVAVLNGARTSEEVDRLLFKTS